MGRAKKILEANGAIVGAWQPIAGGEAGTIDFVTSYADQVSYGTTMQAVSASAEWQSCWAGAMADPTATNVENYLMSDLDPHEGLPTKESRVLVGASFKTRPGRLADHLAHQAAAREHLQRLGAQVRSVQMIGRSPGTLTTIMGLEDFAHYGEFVSKFEIDEKWAAFWLELAADPSAEEVESVVAARVDLPG